MLPAGWISETVKNPRYSGNQPHARYAKIRAMSNAATPVDPADALRQAADRLARARRVYERGERGLALLIKSRESFINSLRHTGLNYAQAKLKFDICLDEQRGQHQQAAKDLDFAERYYGHIVLQMPAA